MKLGIDSYCYHRYFGDAYTFQSKLDVLWSMEDFIKRAVELKVDGVSLESCYFPSFERDYLLRIRGMLDEARLDRVWAWGHPEGLKVGKSLRAAKELERHFEYAKALGASVMRIVGGSSRTRDESHKPQIRRLSLILKEMAKVASSYNIVMAIENHIDFTSDEIVEILSNVDSPYLRVNLDTGNSIRMFEDALEAARKLAPYTEATHIKDLSVGKGSPREFAFWPSVPLGKGIIDIAAIVSMLKDAGYSGLFCVEIDYLKEGYGDEDKGVEESIEYLRGLSTPHPG